jgi:hypothetical protein
MKARHIISFDYLGRLLAVLGCNHLHCRRFPSQTDGKHTAGRRKSILRIEWRYLPRKYIYLLQSKSHGNTQH